MPCCKISDCAQMSKTIIAVRHFGLGGRESLETAVNLVFQSVKYAHQTMASYHSNFYDSLMIKLMVL